MKNIYISLVAALIMISSNAFAEPISTESFNQVVATPPSAISPSINASNSDLCTVGVSGAVQTQVLGISGANTIRDLNCERLKLAKTLYDMGMKVASVGIMCQDRRVFNAMLAAGTPCPIDGKIGEEAKTLWKKNPEQVPKVMKIVESKQFWNNQYVLGSVYTIGLILLVI